MRPIRIRWVDENSITAPSEIDRVQSEIDNLNDFRSALFPGMKVSYNGLWSMLDGKK